MKLTPEFLEEHKIQAAIFDMDGLLIDSEPLWQDAEIEVFGTVGIPMTREIAMRTMGLRVDEVVEYWFHLHPWENKSKEQVANEIVEKLIEHVKKSGTPLPGAIDAINFFKNNNLPIAIASSSSMKIIDAVVDKLGIRDLINIFCSAEFELYGKPHPGVYLNACEKLGINPKNCVAFEDSINGVLSAKSAKIKCIAIPNKDAVGDKRFAIADYEAPTLADLF